MNATHLNRYILQIAWSREPRAITFHSNEERRARENEGQNPRRECYYQLPLSMGGNLEVLRDSKKKKRKKKKTNKKPINKTTNLPKAPHVSPKPLRTTVPRSHHTSNIFTRFPFLINIYLHHYKSESTLPFF